MIVDLCAGMGGWAEAARPLGLTEVGIELDAATCATRSAAGHHTIRADITEMSPHAIHGRIDGLIASPPCQSFSSAGLMDGISDLPEILAHIRRCLPGWTDYDLWAFTDDRSPVVLELLRWSLARVPTWIVAEQVPPVMPIWEAIAGMLRAHGWLTWCGLANAADYGVPQTRIRAFLLAHRHYQPQPPAPTHARHPQPQLFGPELAPWRSMADALGWQDRACRIGFPRRDDLGTSPDGWRARDFRTEAEPAKTLTGKVAHWRTYPPVVDTGTTCAYSAEGERLNYQRPIDRPAPTVDTKAGNSWRIRAVNTGRDWQPGGSRADAQTIAATEPAPAVTGQADAWRFVGPVPPADPDWPLRRPSTTIAGRDIAQNPGHTRERNDPTAKTRNDGIRLELADALILQSFRPDYPVQGSRTSQFVQVGNAVPPLLAQRMLEQVIE